MKPMNHENLMLVSTPDTQAKVGQIKQELSELLWYTPEHLTHGYDQFADTSCNIELADSVRGKNVFVYADCFSDGWQWNLPSKYMMYRWILNAATKNGASQTNIIFPCYPYARSDRQDDSGLDAHSKRVAVMAPMVLQDMIGHGVDNLITLDIHNPVVLSGHSDAKLKTINLSYAWMVEYVIQQKSCQNIELWSTDLWWTKKIWKLAKQLSLNSYIAYKERDNTQPNSVKQVFVEKAFAELSGRDVVVYDDMIDTGGTICEVVNRLHEYNPKSITIVSPHGMFHGRALEKLWSYVEQWIIESVVVSDSITRSHLPEWITVLPTHKLFANTIASILQWESIDHNAAV